MATKMFTIAGTSVLNGIATFRFATGKMSTRLGVLKRNDHTEIKLEQLPREMTKADAIAYLQSKGISAVVPVGKKDSAKAKAAAEAKAKAEADEKTKREAKNAKRRQQRAQKRAEAAASTLVDAATADVVKDLEQTMDEQQDSTVTE